LIILNKNIAYPSGDQTPLTFSDYQHWQDRLNGLETMPLANTKRLLDSFNKCTDKGFNGIYGQVIEIQVKLCESWYKRCEFIANIQDRTLLKRESEKTWQAAGVDFKLLDDAIESYHSLTRDIEAIKSLPKDKRETDCYNILEAEFNFGLANFYMLRHRQSLDPTVWETSKHHITAALGCDPSVMSEELKERATLNHLKYQNYWGILLEYRDPKQSVDVGLKLVEAWDTLCAEKGKDLNLKSPFPGRARMNLAERTLNLYQKERKSSDGTIVPVGLCVITDDMLRTALGHVRHAKAYFDLYPEIYTHEVTNAGNLISDISAILDL
jgi:hypothetical protein